MQSEQWTDNRRADGLVVTEGLGTWVVIPAEDNGLPIDRCPCCNRALDTAADARAVADFRYRVKHNDSEPTPPMAA